MAETPDEVQWFNGSGSGVRSWALYGITKVHLAHPQGDDVSWSRGSYDRTLCGHVVPGPNMRISPEASDDRCKRCARQLSIREEE